MKMQRTTLNTTTLFVLMTFFCLVPVSSVWAQPPGGREGGERGGRGGFDPSSFLDRMDRNQNGKLDPDEQKGPISGLMERLGSYDSKIKPGSAISLRRIKQAFEKMRNGGGSAAGRDRNNRGQNDRNRDNRRREDPRQDNEDLSAEMLVPGFGAEMLPDLLLGFGSAAELSTATYTDDDLREANERIRQFDKNKNGYIDPNEITRRFAGQPMDFDRNRDGRLSATELAVRQARRREAKDEREQDDRRKKEKSRDRKESPAENVDLYGGRRSYRPLSSRSIEGVPGFFTDKDADGNAQLTMSEFAAEWTDDLIAEFNDYDFDGDGVITADEAVRSVEEGKVSQVLANSTTSNGGATTAPQPAAISAATTPSTVGKADEKYMKYARSMVSKYDRNGDEALTLSEMKKMMIKPTKADINRDGKVAVDEYAWYLQARDQRFQKK